MRTEYIYRDCIDPPQKITGDAYNKFWGMKEGYRGRKKVYKHPRYLSSISEKWLNGVLEIIKKRSGQVIKLDEFVEELGCSNATVRAAISNLVEKGLVIKLPGKVKNRGLIYKARRNQ